MGDCTASFIDVPSDGLIIGDLLAKLSRSVVSSNQSSLNLRAIGHNLAKQIEEVSEFSRQHEEDCRGRISSASSASATVTHDIANLKQSVAGLRDKTLKQKLLKEELENRRAEDDKTMEELLKAQQRVRNAAPDLQKLLDRRLEQK